LTVVDQLVLCLCS